MKIKLLFATLATLVIGSTLSTVAYSQTADDALNAIDSCGYWSNKDGQACDFVYGNHEFRIWQPQIVKSHSNFRVSIKFDHKLANRTDDHWYVSITNRNGQCSLQDDIAIDKSNGGRVLGIVPIRIGDEPAWEEALTQVVQNVAFTYGCL